jgi:hypothetical protein
MLHLVPQPCTVKQQNKAKHTQRENEERANGNKTSQRKHKTRKTWTIRRHTRKTSLSPLHHSPSLTAVVYRWWLTHQQPASCPRSIDGSTETSKIWGVPTGSPRRGPKSTVTSPQCIGTRRTTPCRSYVPSTRSASARSAGTQTARHQTRLTATHKLVSTTYA